MSLIAQIVVGLLYDRVFFRKFLNLREDILGFGIFIHVLWYSCLQNLISD